jgi:hypothetical protein
VTSGRSYTAANLEANVRGVAAGAPPAATSQGVPGAQAPGGAATPQRLGGTPEPLARLRTKAGLAACLRELSAGADGRPLVVDYATYQGGPAMVVVYPGGPASYHVFVVGPRCAAANADLRQFANVPRRG